MREIKFIVIHCPATCVNTDYTPAQLGKDHKLRGFVEAGYHFYIRKSGEIVRLRPDKWIKQCPCFNAWKEYRMI
ncbi:peptidoglycan recognition protein family protein [Parabacteroides pacaensis]|uniref:N-acetylmuramoyl-L-alanine amidase n=1 Tax=Parabacteroides pacaensis TaxID=2086575 RepID=UPI000D0E6A0D|nr:N-acetylmuramoyl-L-alanine amidase [Parabacteroides pacaensis]